MNNLSVRILFAGISVLLLLSVAAEAAPQKDIMLVLDNSGSMRKNDPTFLARGAVASFINKLDADSRVGVLIFDQGVRLAVPLVAIDDDSRKILIKSLDDINYRGQLTNSPAAVERAIYELKTNAREGAGRFIVFMTDGIVDTGNPEIDVEKTKWLRDELSVDAADNAIKVFSIAFTEHADFFLIQSLAKKTGAEYFRALTPADLASVFDLVRVQLDMPPAESPAPPEELVPVPAPIPAPVAVPTTTPAEPPVSESAPVVTPLPDDTVQVEPLAGQGGDELLATLTADERQALEEISQQTGIPIEELALELVGPETGAMEGSFADSGAIITYPDDELTVEEQRMAYMILAGAAVLLLLLVLFIVWFVMRRRKASPAVAAAPDTASADEGPAMPEAFINDINGYTDNATMKLGEKPVMVGRVAGTDTQHLDYLVVNKGTVGRRHAIIKYKDYSFWIIDQGSVNGTFVNGERLSGERQLKHGDRVRFHKYDFEFAQPDMDDGFHTVFADPDLAEATIVADAATLAATSAMDLQASAGQPPAAPVTDTDDLFAVDEDIAAPAGSDDGPSAAFADSSAFADADVFDITGETAMPGDVGDETIDEGATAVFDSPLVTDAEGFDEDEEDLGVEINLDVVAPPAVDEDFDAEASAFFEDITVGPIPDDEAGPTPDIADEQSSLDAKLEQATAILDGTATQQQADEAGDFGEMETTTNSNLDESEDLNDFTLEQFIETDSFDAPETIPPAMPKSGASDDPGDVTLDAFMSTSMFEGVDLTNEDETVLPEFVPDEARDQDGINAGDTVVIDRSKDKDDKNDKGDDGSEDPTVVK